MFYSLVIVCERWDPGRVEAVEVAVEDVEAEVAHVRLHDGRRFWGCRVARCHSLHGMWISDFIKLNAGLCRNGVTVTEVTEVTAI